MTYNVYVISNGKCVYTHQGVPDDELDNLVLEVESDPFLRVHVEKVNPTREEVQRDQANGR